MIIDAIALMILVLAIIKGWKRGLVAALLSFIAIILGFIFSLKLSYSLAAYLASHNWVKGAYSLPIAFLAIFIGTIFAMRMLTKAAEGVLKFAMLNWVNKLGGVVLFAGLYLFMWSAALWFGNSIGILGAGLAQDSKSLSYLSPIAPAMVGAAQQYLPFCQGLIQSAQQLLQK